MIPLLLTAGPYTPVLPGLIILVVSLAATACLLLGAALARAGAVLHMLCLLLIVPATALALGLPLLWQNTATPFVQAVFLVPLLGLPLSLPLRTLPSSWSATAVELGADRAQQVRLLWWPLLKTPMLISLSLTLVCGILQ